MLKKTALFSHVGFPNIMVPFWDYVTFMNCEKKIYIYQELQEQPQGLLEEVEQCCKENVSLVRKVFFFKCIYMFRL